SNVHRRDGGAANAVIVVITPRTKHSSTPSLTPPQAISRRGLQFLPTSARTFPFPSIALQGSLDLASFGSLVSRAHLIGKASCMYDSNMSAVSPALRTQAMSW